MLLLLILEACETNTCIKSLNPRRRDGPSKVLQDLQGIVCIFRQSWDCSVPCTSQTPCAMSSNGVWKRVLEFCLFGPCGYNLGGYVGPNPQAFMEILKEQRELQENCRPLGRYFMFFNNANSGLESHMSANKIYLVFILSCVR